MESVEEMNHQEQLKEWCKEHQYPAPNYGYMYALTEGTTSCTVDAGPFHNIQGETKSSEHEALEHASMLCLEKIDEEYEGIEREREERERLERKALSRWVWIFRISGFMIGVAVGVAIYMTKK